MQFCCLKTANFLLFYADKTNKYAAIVFLRLFNGENLVRREGELIFTGWLRLASVFEKHTGVGVYQKRICDLIASQP